MLTKQKMMPKAVVEISIPRKLIYDCYMSDKSLGVKKSAKLRRKKTEIELTINSLRSVVSIVERCLLKGTAL